MADDDRPLADGYAVEVFDAARANDVVDLWTRENAVDPAQMRARVDEVLLLATWHGEAVGVASAYLAANERLRVTLWHQRVFVAAGHRKANLSYHLTTGTLALLEGRFVTGDDARAIGILYEPENRSIAAYYDQAVWPWTGACFVGRNQRGDAVYVRYFAGALLPSS